MVLPFVRFPSVFFLDRNAVLSYWCTVSLLTIMPDPFGLVPSTGPQVLSPFASGFVIPPQTFFVFWLLATLSKSFDPTLVVLSSRSFSSFSASLSAFRFLFYVSLAPPRDKENLRKYSYICILPTTYRKDLFSLTPTKTKP